MKKEIDYGNFDISNPIHARAYRLAASHFLSDLGGYSAQELEDLLNLDEDEATPEQLERRSKIIPWEPIEKACHCMDDPYRYTADLIEGLAFDFLNFRAE